MARHTVKPATGEVRHCLSLAFSLPFIDLPLPLLDRPCLSLDLPLPFACVSTALHSSRQWLSLATLQGTRLWRSIYAEKGQPVSRRSDLDALGYVTQSFLDLSLPFIDLSLSFPDLSLTFHCPSLTFHCSSLTIHSSQRAAGYGRACRCCSTWPLPRSRGRRPTPTGASRCCLLNAFPRPLPAFPRPFTAFP